MENGLTSASVGLPPPQQLAVLPREQRNALLLYALNAGAFDFLDFGTHKGGGLQVGRTLGGRLGLGIELVDRKVIDALKAGLYVLSEDAFLLPPLRNAVKFAVLSHVLEHLPDEATAYLVLKKIASCCSDFVFIQQPDFSEEAMLWRKGLQFAHTNMKGHLWRPNTRRLIEMLWSLGFGRFLVGGQNRVRSSSNAWLHRADVQSSTLWKHKPEKDPLKPDVSFDPPLYRNVAIAIAKSSNVDLRDIFTKAKVVHVHFESFSIIS
jgi:hypothetical protein